MESDGQEFEPPHFAPETYFRRALPVSEAVVAMLGNTPEVVGADGRYETGARGNLARDAAAEFAGKGDEPVSVSRWSIFVEAWDRDGLLFWPGAVTEDDCWWAERRLIVDKPEKASMVARELVGWLAELAGDTEGKLRGRTLDSAERARVYRAARVVASFCRTLKSNKAMREQPSDWGRRVSVARFRGWLIGALSRESREDHELLRRFVELDVFSENAAIRYVVRAWIDIFVDGWRPGESATAAGASLTHEDVLKEYVMEFPPPFEASDKMVKALYRVWNMGGGGTPRRLELG